MAVVAAIAPSIALVSLPVIDGPLAWLRFDRAMRTTMRRRIGPLEGKAR
jgi:hypothetical protein